MQYRIVIILVLLSNTLYSQNLRDVEAIKKEMLQIDNDKSLIKKTLDSASFQKEDGGPHWDSVYHHKDIYYRNGEIVKVVSWNSFPGWRNDTKAYYFGGKPIYFAKGESPDGGPYFGLYNFGIYYPQQSTPTVIWLTPKPENVIDVDKDIFLTWAQDLSREAIR